MAHDQYHERLLRNPAEPHKSAERADYRSGRVNCEMYGVCLCSGGILRAVSALERFGSGETRVSAQLDLHWYPLHLDNTDAAETKLCSLRTSTRTERNPCWCLAPPLYTQVVTICSHPVDTLNTTFVHKSRTTLELGCLPPYRESKADVMRRVAMVSICASGSLPSNLLLTTAPFGLSLPLTAVAWLARIARLLRSQ